MDIKVTTEQGRVPVTILHIKGEIDSATYQTFQSAAEKLIADGARHLLIDLQDAPYISSAGLRALHNLFNKLRAIHKDVNDDELRLRMKAGTYKSPYLKVANLSPQVKDAFELSGFETYIEVLDDINKAVASF
ncbi:MAG: STAS domain-containing protein [Anaerolineales bacterium]|nr:STAS domain-containing protein [Anaerolineales bacterium]